MTFHPDSLSEATLKDFAKSLHQGAAEVLPDHPVKLSQAQELLARTLNHRSWHHALKRARSNPKKKKEDNVHSERPLEQLVDDCRDESLTEAMDRLTGAIKRFKVNHGIGQDIQSLSLHFSHQLAKEVEALGWVFTVEGCDLDTDEVCSPDGLLPLLFFAADLGQEAGVSVRLSQSALCDVLIDLDKSKRQHTKWKRAIVAVLKRLGGGAPANAQVSLDSVWEHFQEKRNMDELPWPINKG